MSWQKLSRQHQTLDENVYMGNEVGEEAATDLFCHICLIDLLFNLSFST